MPSLEGLFSSLVGPNANDLCDGANKDFPVADPTRRGDFTNRGDDFIDEVLGFFKANVLFKSFQPAGSADRVLLYLTLYTTQALANGVAPYVD